MFKILIEHEPCSSRLISRNQMTCISDKSKLKIPVVLGPSEIGNIIIVFPHCLFGLSPLLSMNPPERVHISQNPNSIDNKIILPIINKRPNICIKYSLQRRFK